jgi:hypothetical protein
MKRIAWIILLVSLFTACTKGTNERYLIIKFQYSDTLPTYNDTGALITDADRQFLGVEGLTPLFNNISAHQVLLLRDSLASTEEYPLYIGEEYFGRRGFDSMGIDLSSAKFVKEGENFIAIPLTMVKPGSYEWMKIEFSYQNLNVPFRLDTIIPSFRNPNTGVQYPGASFNGIYASTIAGFLGHNTFIDNGYNINTVFTRMDSQYLGKGVYALETQLGTNAINYPTWTKTDRAGHVVAVNHLHKSQPNVLGFDYTVAAINTSRYNKNGDFVVAQSPLVITGTEKESIVINCMLSTNKCFEWSDNNGNKLWDPYKGEPITTLGFRGMKPVVVK